MASKFRYTFREKLPSIPSVYIAHFGRKYFIWKGMALHSSVDTIAKEIDRSIRLGAKEGSIYEKIVHHIKYARIVQMEIEVVLQSENPADLLVKEHELLQAAKTDELCLNLSFEPYLPKWLSETAVLDYRKRTAPPSTKGNRKRNKTLKSAGEGKGQSAKKKPAAGQLLKPRKASGVKTSSTIGLSSKGKSKTNPKPAKAR